MVRDVTNSIMAGAVIRKITIPWDALPVVAIIVQVLCVTNLSSLAVFIRVASTKVFTSPMSTDGMRLWTVVVCGTA